MSILIPRDLRFNRTSTAVWLNSKRNNRRRSQVDDAFTRDSIFYADMATQGYSDLDPMPTWFNQFGSNASQPTGSLQPVYDSATQSADMQVGKEIPFSPPSTTDYYVLMFRAALLNGSTGFNRIVYFESDPNNFVRLVQRGIGNELRAIVSIDGVQTGFNTSPVYFDGAEREYILYCCKNDADPANSNLELWIDGVQQGATTFDLSTGFNPSIADIEWYGTATDKIRKTDVLFPSETPESIPDYINEIRNSSAWLA